MNLMDRVKKLIKFQYNFETKKIFPSKDGRGVVDFTEFSNVMADQLFKEPSQNELDKAFDFFDTGSKLLNHID